MMELEFRKLCLKFQEGHPDLSTPDGAYRKCSVCFDFPLTEEVTIIKLRGLMCEVPNLHELWKTQRYVDTQSLQEFWDFTYFAILYHPSRLVYDPSHLQFNSSSLLPHICDLNSLYDMWNTITIISASVVRINERYRDLGIADTNNMAVVYVDKQVV